MKIIEMSREITQFESEDPFSLFIYGFNSPSTKEKCVPRLNKFFEFINLSGNIQERCSTFAKNAKDQPSWAVNSVMKYLQMNKNRVEKKEISRTKLIRVRRYMKDHKFDRLFEIAKEGFVSQHLDRIDDLLLIKKEMWECYFAQKKADPIKAVQMLALITQVQPYLSQYYAAFKYIMLKVRRAQDYEKNNPGFESDYIPDLRFSK